jgi:tRNA(fMet)-specific endonuclease VapC
LIYLLDTNVVSDAHARRGRVYARLLGHAAPDLGIPSLVSYELARGALIAGFGAARRRALDQFVSIFPTVPFEAGDATHAADIEATLRPAGAPIGQLDTLIAGTARSRGLVLVTRNTLEFCRVPGLMLADWF